MSQMPEIKPVVNKEPERDKKKAGLLARLFGGGGSGGTAGFGGFGGAGAGGGGMGALAGGGLLATKAGLMALILVGTTVAGGIGMVGYRLFGPGAEMTGNGDNLQLFAPRPKESANADGQGGAKGDGSSASLQYLSQANTTPKEAAVAASEAPKDATAAGAAGSEAASSSGAGPLNQMGNTGNGVNKGLLKNSGKFGSLSAPGGGGGSGAVANSAPQKSAAVDAASKGSLSGFKKGAAASVSGGTGRSVAGRHFGSAGKQAFGVLANQKGAQSSYAAGQTYDGAANGGGNIGANGTPIGGAGAVAAGGAQPKSLPGPKTDTNDSTNIPTPTAKAAAPWAGLLQTAEILIGIAVALLAVSYFINKPPTPPSVTIAKIIGGVVCALGAAVIMIGATIASKYGQKQFGLIGLGIGAVLIALGINNLFTPDPPTAAAATNTGVANSGAAAVTNTAMAPGATAAPTLPGAGLTAPVAAPPVVPADAPPIPPGIGNSIGIW